ncbi:MAG: hypothetical protein Kow0058_19370 [Roseovarius sp.]
MPKLVRLYIRHCAIGFAIAALFVAMLLAFDVAGLRHLILNSDKGVVALLVLWISNGVIFAGVQFAIAVMRMKDDDDDHHGGRRQRRARTSRLASALLTIPVRAGGSRRRPF